MWTDAHVELCRKHRDLVAVYHDGEGRIALLLRHTFLPLLEERGRWLADTRRVARAVINDFHAAGVIVPISVLQWRSPQDAAHILERWTRCYESDAERREQLADIARARLRDASLSLDQDRLARPEWHPVSRLRFVDWYRDMAPSWLAVEPPLRRQLVLCAHRWIVERVLLPMSRGQTPAAADLQPTGRLTWMLVRSIPTDDLETWKPWLRLVRTDLLRALAWPEEKRSEAWIRWLFLIPYSIPTSGRHRRPSDPRAAAAGEGW